MQKTKGNYATLIKYSQKTLKVNFADARLVKSAKFKTFAPAGALRAVLSAFLIGKNSAREIEKHLHKLQGFSSWMSRQTIGNLLDEPRTADFLTCKLLNIFRVARTNRVFTDLIGGRLVIGLIDGIDLGEVHNGGGRCAYCIERKHNDGSRFFHRVVVLSVMSKYGPLPIYARWCRSTELKLNSELLSEERLKSECELSCAKALLTEVADRFNGRLPFDIIASDALMANAPFMEHVENLGAAGIFIFKQENRKLYKQAQADFCGKTFGFHIHRHQWNADPSGKGRTFASQWGCYNDSNRKGDKSVRIFSTRRFETDGTQVEGMAITSDRAFISPELVEAVRFSKWRDLENGVFNALTNQWGILKHIFFHKAKAMESVLSLQFLALTISLFYRYGNLCRGGRSFTGTLRDFFAHMAFTLDALLLRKPIAVKCNSP